MVGRAIVQLLSVGGLVCVVGCSKVAPEPDARVPATSRPNIVVIMTDDQPTGLHRPDTLPNVFERIAAEGMTFENSFTVTPLCSPSRATFMTGQYARRHKVTENFPPKGGAIMLDDSKTLATSLQAAGYRTSLVGKYMNAYYAISPEVPPGWDDWHVFVDVYKENSLYFNYDLNENGEVRRYGNHERDYSTDILRARAVDFIREQKGNPFFLWFSPFAPHYSAKKPLRVEAAPRHDGAFDHEPPWRPPSYNEPDAADKPGWIQQLPAWNVDYRRDMDAYYRDQLDSLLAVDEAVGAILDALEAEGMADNTVVIFTSDNGYLNGEHRIRGKRVHFEEALRVPLMVRYPAAVSADTVDTRFALNVDLAPTIAHLAGAEGLTPDGTSLVPLLQGASPENWRKDFMVESFTSGRLNRPYVGLRGERHIYVRSPAEHDGPQTPGHHEILITEEFYDVLEDPYQLENLSASEAHQEALEVARERLNDLIWDP